RHRLNERERREPESRHVEDPAEESRAPAGEPAPVGEEQLQRVQRPPQREPWQQRRDAVLHPEAPVERQRRGQRHHEPSGDPPHAVRLPPNGRYDSAASAAIPTLGKSRRCSKTTNRFCHSGRNFRLNRSRLSSWNCPFRATSTRRCTFWKAESCASGA